MTAEELDTLIVEVKDLMQQHIDFKYNGIVPSRDSLPQSLLDRMGSIGSGAPITRVAEKMATRDQFEKLLDNRSELENVDLSYEDYCTKF